MESMRDRNTRVEFVEAGKLRLALRFADGLLEAVGLTWATGAGPDAGLSPLGREMQSALERYARGLPACWPELPLAWERCTPFARCVLEALLREVPAGRTVSYGELAGLAGNPRAARAVGRALGANPWPLVVPCHRVLGARGALTGFTNPCGVEMKAYLLELEARARA